MAIHHQDAVVRGDSAAGAALFQPPQMDAARAEWQKTIQLAPGSASAQQAQALLDGAGSQ
jgi:hypothetical protein